MRGLPAGEYGVNDLFVGVPVKLGSERIEKVNEVKLTADEKTGLEKSEAAVKELCGVIGVERVPVAAAKLAGKK